MYNGTCTTTYQILTKSPTPPPCFLSEIVLLLCHAELCPSARSRKGIAKPPWEMDGAGFMWCFCGISAQARCEQDEESLRKHRQFDTPFALLPKDISRFLQMFFVLILSRFLDRGWALPALTGFEQSEGEEGWPEPVLHPVLACEKHWGRYGFAKKRVL